MVKKPVIALLGGGQLGRMFLENAMRYDVEVHVLDPDPACPCAALATRFTQGSFNDHGTVMRFAEGADVIGIEIEHVSVEALSDLKRAGKLVIPDPEVLRTIKDKGLQKEFYRAHGIPSAAFELIDGPDDIGTHTSLIPGFLKSRTGGYDGKGVMPIRTVADAAHAFSGSCVLEAHTDISVELAVLVVRAADGSHVVYDPVEMVFDPRFNLVDHLRTPSRLGEDVLTRAKALAVRVAAAFAAPGLYAVELFLDATGNLLVNETAPRAHNSGHHTIEACASSQFDQLLRLYMGWPAGDPTLRGCAAMVNLVGEDGTGTPTIAGLDEVLRIPGTFVHLYGKKETRTGRKMGHISILAPDHTALEHAIQVSKKYCRVRPMTRITA